MITVSHAALSDRGRTHDENQDRWLADAGRGLYLVADGMGEAVSPQLVVEEFPGLLSTALAVVSDLRDERAADRVRAALSQISSKVRAERATREEITGTTVVLALVRGGRALVAHLGDSRAYLLRAGKLERLTRDHSLLEKMIALGWIKPEEASWRGNGGPTRYAGMSGQAVVDVRGLELQAGDRLLLCSDGLTEMLDDEEIAPLLGAPTPEEACARLLASANQAGGEDNITVLVLAVF